MTLLLASVILDGFVGLERAELANDRILLISLFYLNPSGTKLNRTHCIRTHLKGIALNFLPHSQSLDKVDIILINLLEEKVEHY